MKNSIKMMKQPNYSLTIGWLYPELMNTYGDRGNIIVLQKRAEWRDIKTTVKRLDIDFSEKDLLSCDLLFMGGAQDKEQKIVGTDLRKKKTMLAQMINQGTPGLYICGAYQFLGKYYKEADGTIINGLDIFDIYTENPGENSERLIGNTIVTFQNTQLVGFENHGGRTYLGEHIAPFATVVVGFGNNGKDKTEGAVYKNSFGTYLHGPILPKNPSLADYLLEKALEIKYTHSLPLTPLAHDLEQKAKDVIVKRYFPSV